MSVGSVTLELVYSSPFVAIPGILAWRSRYIPDNVTIIKIAGFLATASVGFIQINVIG